MTPVKVKIARREIERPDHAARRLQKLNLDICYFLSRRNAATTTTERRFYSDMLDIYVKRYNWYLK